MTNLTKEIRAAIIESVIDGTFIPSQRDAIIKSTSDAVRAQLVSYLPPGFEAAIATLPPAWFEGETAHSLHARHNPVSILAGHTSGWGDVKFNKFLRPYSGWTPLVNYQQDKDSSHHWYKVLAAQIDAATKLRAKEEALRAELAGFLASCRTYKQVIEKMPDLERHLPAPPAKAFPVVTSTKPLQSTLAKLGFDRSAA